MPSVRLPVLIRRRLLEEVELGKGDDSRSRKLHNEHGVEVEEFIACFEV